MKVLTIGLENYLQYHLSNGIECTKIKNLSYSDLLYLDFVEKINEFKMYDVLIVGINEYEVTSKVDFSMYFNILNSIIYIIENSVNFKKVIFLSTYEVYKNKKDGTYSENDNIEPYSYISAIYNTYENMLRIACEKKEICMIIMRLFNVYGILQNEKYVIMSILNQLFKNDYVLVGNSRKERDYIYIKDFINIINMIIKHEFKDKYYVYNIGNGKSNNIKDVIMALKNTTGIDKKIVFNPEMIRTNHDYEIVKADNSKLIKEFNYSFKYDLNHGIKDLVEIYRISEVNKQ